MDSVNGIGTSRCHCNLCGRNRLGNATVRLPTHASAAVIVLGMVVSVTSWRNDAQTQIFTQIELRPEELLKRTVSADRVTFFQAGERVDNEGSVVAETTSFTVGKRALVFLTPRRDGTLGVMGLFQGRFDIEWNPASGREIAVWRAPGSGQAADQMTLDQLRSAVTADCK